MKLHRMSIGVLLLVAILALGIAIAGDKEPVEHPTDMDGYKDCVQCHMEETPEAFKEWYNGDHGLFNVKCTVCHGSTGDDFTMEPSMDRCVACHADQVYTMDSPPNKGKTCFDCHDNHKLTAHGM